MEVYLYYRDSDSLKTDLLRIEVTKIIRDYFFLSNFGKKLSNFIEFNMNFSDVKNEREKLQREVMKFILKQNNEKMLKVSTHFLSICELFRTFLTIFEISSNFLKHFFF